MEACEHAVSESHPFIHTQMGYCSIRQQYSPELVREKAIGSPGAFFALCMRGAQIGWEVGLFYAGLWMDSLSGQADDSMQARPARDWRRLGAAVGGTAGGRWFRRWHAPRSSPPQPACRAGLHAAGVGPGAGCRPRGRLLTLPSPPTCLRRLSFAPRSCGTCSRDWAQPSSRPARWVLPRAAGLHAACPARGQCQHQPRSLERVTACLDHLRLRTHACVTPPECRARGPS